jgi:hypothetical protein
MSRGPQECRFRQRPPLPPPGPPVPGRPKTRRHWPVIFIIIFEKDFHVYLADRSYQNRYNIKTVLCKKK